MFRERIDSTPFTSEEAGYFFKNITQDKTFAGDMSFLATTRALLANRIPENEPLELYYRSFELSKSDMDRFDDERILKRVLGDIPATENRITITELVNSDTAPKIFEVIRTSFAESNPGWVCVEKAEAYFRRNFPMFLFTNADLKSSVIFVDRLTLRKWHFLQVVAFLATPWYFEGEQKITESEYEFVKTLTSDNPTAYLDALRVMSTQFDFEKSRIRRLLDGFELEYERRRADTIKNDMDRKRRQIEDYNNAVGSLLAELRDANYQLIALKSALESHSGESQLMDYFLADRRLGIESCENGTLRFTVKGFIDNYDEDAAEAMISNDRSQMYESYTDKRIDKEDMRKLMTAVFLDRKIRIRSCAAYVFSIGNSISVSAQEDKRYPSEFSTYLPNPHIQNYGCMGEYRRIINEILRDGNYVSAIAQCEASCDSLNFGDYTVMSRFCEVMYRGSGKYFELPNGDCVDQVAAVAWLKEQEGANE